MASSPSAARSASRSRCASRIVDASESTPELVLVQVNELIHRRQMERALRESEQRVQDLVDNVDALIYIKSADGRYLLINRHFEETFGIRRDDPVVKTNYDIVSPDTAAVYTANDRRVIEAGIPIHFEEPKSAGDSGTWLSLKFPLFDEDGQPYAVGGHLHRHHRAQDRRGRGAPGQGRGGAGQPRQERLPLAHEPRAAHAAQLDPGLRPAAAARAAAGGRDRQRRPHRQRRPPPARADQRGARDLAHRGRPAAAARSSRCTAAGR